MLRTQDKRLHLGQTMAQIFSGPLYTGPNAYIENVMLDTPRAFYKMQDTSGNPVDSSGNSLNLTSVAGTPEYQQTGPMGDYGIRCVGGETLDRSGHISTVTNNLTMEGWFNVELTTGDDQILFYNGNSGSNGWGIVVDNNGKFQYLCGGVALGTASSAAIEGVGYRHIVVVRDAGTWKYYVNGVSDTANAGTTAPGTPSGVTKMGGGSVQTVYAYVAVYETALSAATILTHYNASGV